MELLKQKLDFPMTHAPFKGSAESKLKVMSGMLAATSDSLPAIYGNIQAGQLKALAVVDDQRSAYLPDVPTLAEAGFQNPVDGGFFRPGGAPGHAPGSRGHARQGIAAGRAHARVRGKCGRRR